MKTKTLSALAATVAEDLLFAHAREYFARVNSAARAERDALARTRGRHASDRAARVALDRAARVALARAADRAGISLES